LIDRPAYLRRLEGLRDAPVVKVLTGLRRSGKSGLLALAARDLRDQGVGEDRLVYLDFDDLANAPLASAAALDAHIRAVTPPEGRFYVLLDEVQEVDQWERVVNSLQASGRAGVTITGSNARVLSGELGTYLTGRYVALDVNTLTFAEYLDFAGAAPDAGLADHFDRFVRLGGFPGSHVYPFSDADVRLQVSDIYRSILVRDVLTRHRIRDADMFERVAAFVLDNVGNPFSARRVADFMKSQQRGVNHQTVLAYVAALEEAFLVHRLRRVDVRGRRLLATDEKLYAGDHGLVNAVFGYQPSRLPGLLENIVQAELRGRGYEVFVGKQGDAEIDFVGERAGERVYLQVAVTALDATTRRREFAPLLAVRDSYPKYVVTLDRLAGGNEDGVRHVWLPEFLLDPAW
jgi:predicted AAA+ superfamily ATPase